MIEHAMGVLYLHLSWRIRRAAELEEYGPEETELEAIVEKRATLLAKMEDLCIGTNSNAVEGVKQAVRSPVSLPSNLALICRRDRLSLISSISISFLPERLQRSTILTENSQHSRSSYRTKSKLEQQDS